MNEDQHHSASALLPYRFKIAGWVLVICTLAAGIWFTNLLEKGQTESMISGLKICLLIGLFLTMAGRDKQEDELISLWRLKSMEWSFRWGFLYVAFCLTMNEPHEAPGAMEILLSMVTIYHLVFYFKKRQG